MDYSLTLPGGSQLPGNTPVVVIGPNGSGKTRQTRNMTSEAPMDFVNALRNTRVAPEIPAMGFDAARSNFENQRNQARFQYWEITSEFDFMLSQLLANDSMEAKEFIRKYRDDPNSAGAPKETPLSRVESLWGDVFPGRSLRWRDWKPVVVSTTSGGEVEYSGNQMSDGEKAALFLSGRVFTADPGVLIIDEPETHFHSLLAVRLWNALEDARPDLRFVYVTHDLTFAMSRRKAQYVIASPIAGLRPIELDDRLPSDVAEALLGSASLSFYASRIVFCEGDQSSFDNRLYSAWFNGADTVVRPVNNCQAVIRCTEALQASGVAHSLSVQGITDRDYYGDAFISSLKNVHVLPVHEVESLLSWPAVVGAVAEHMSSEFSSAKYLESARSTVSDEQRTSIIIERWKARIEPNLTAITAGAKSKGSSLASLTSNIPSMFDMANWNFSPQNILAEEEGRVEAALNSRQCDPLFAIIPGKQLLPVAARTVGMDRDSYVSLVLRALQEKDGGTLGSLRDNLVAALTPLLPPRAVPVAIPDPPTA